MRSLLRSIRQGSSRSSVSRDLSRLPFKINTFGYGLNMRTMASQTTTSDIISNTTKAEGGPTKGSTSAQLQSSVGKTQNFEQAAQSVGRQMQTDPGSITSEDAAYLKSREARATGVAQPPADSISADAQRLAAANEGATKPERTAIDPAAQYRVDKVQNFETAAAQVGEKLKSDPTQITKDEAALLHSRERRAFGDAEKGGIAAQAQSAAAQNGQR